MKYHILSIGTGVGLIWNNETGMPGFDYSLSVGVQIFQWYFSPHAHVRAGYQNTRYNNNDYSGAKFAYFGIEVGNTTFLSKQLYVDVSYSHSLTHLEHAMLSANIGWVFFSGDTRKR